MYPETVQLDANGHASIIAGVPMPQVARWTVPIPPHATSQVSQLPSQFNHRNNTNSGKSLL